MRKFLIGSLMFLVFAVTVPLVANAQTCYPRRAKAKATKRYAVRSYNYQKPSFWQRHRNLRNVALATGGGALIGGLWGGNRKGIAKGALVGAGAGALYTYILKPKKRNY